MHIFRISSVVVHPDGGPETPLLQWETRPLFMTTFEHNSLWLPRFFSPYCPNNVIERKILGYFTHVLQARL